MWRPQAAIVFYFKVEFRGVLIILSFLNFQIIPIPGFSKGVALTRFLKGKNEGTGDGLFTRLRSLSIRVLSIF